MDAIVTTCAIVGAVLGVLNFVQAWRKDQQQAKREQAKAGQHLVRAEYRTGHTETKRRASDLYVVNADTRPVTALLVDFYLEPDAAQSVYSKECTSLGPDADIFVRQFTSGGPKCASFTYTDADDQIHRYTQSTI